MNVRNKDQKGVTLMPSSLAMNQTLDMTLYLINEYVLENSTSLSGGIVMTIRMKRKILSEMMTTYFPSLLLMMITYATTFFKPLFFEAALSVNLTTMLVMTTIFISKMESLPNTSDIKMIDSWLILCQLVPFAQVVLLTIREYLREEEQEENFTLEKDQATEVTQDTTKVKVQDQDNTKTREAWTIPQIKPSKHGSLAVLGMIGKVVMIFHFYRRCICFREESAATVCAFCLHRLLCNRGKFLF